ncbi:hypothetical protein DM02DRAFT_155306 [Periconia macrospinosa]|uniref:Anaphase-promoting complex, subunit CDC26 n=1 Tax=Periconia macrospinosa TaxID=97972 RepID=A0A2V1EDI4_9PLEO|nr:hypothetical protein DM02DRAFT_155306 [Periconia macrospinosa]
MLRRPATTIHLSAADLELYEANRQRKNWEKQQQLGEASPSTNDGSEKDKAPKKPTQKDRIMGGGGQGR